jgi:hypothetical protein
VGYLNNSGAVEKESDGEMQPVEVRRVGRCRSWMGMVAGLLCRGVGKCRLGGCSRRSLGWDIENFQIYEREALQCKSLGGWRLLQEPIKANLP